MTDAVRSERRGPATHITINRPEAKNAINLDVLRQLGEALAGAERDPESRVIVLQGTGGDFSAGGDIKDMVARRGQATATYERLRTGLGALVRTLTKHPQPVVARIDGVCLGAGGGVALACDAAIATERSTFGFPFVKLGLVPDTATSWLLPRLAGIQHARRLLIGGDTVDAKEAARLGLLTALVPDAPALDADVQHRVALLAALPPTAVRDVKRLFWTNLATPLDTAVLHEAMVQGIRFATPEHAAAADAFLARKGAR